MLLLCYLIVGLALAYGYEGEDGPALTHYPIAAAIIVVAWPAVVWTICRDQIGNIKKWRGQKIGNKT
jgi:hypothetical protein